MPSPLARWARNVGWLAAGELTVKLGLLAVALLVARGFGPAALGSFTLAYNAALLAVVALCCGQVETLIRETAARPAEARALLAGALALQDRLILPLVAVAAAGALAVGEPTLRWSLAAFLPYALLRARLATQAAPFKGLDRMEVEVKARALEVGLAVPLVAAAAQLGWPLWTCGAALAAGAGTGLVWLGPKLAELGPRQARAPLEPLLAEGWPFLGLSLLMQLLFRLDVFLLAAFGRPREEIGLYGAAAALVWGLLALPQLLALSIYPSLSRTAASARGPSREAVATAGLGAGLGTVLALALGWARWPLIAVAFGEPFAGAAPLLAILAWALPGASAAMLLGTVLAAWRGQRLSLALQAAAVGLSLALNAAWIPGRGTAGAARAAVVVQAGLAAALLAALLLARPRRAGGEAAGRPTVEAP